MNKPRLNILLENGLFLTHVRRYVEGGIAVICATDFVNSTHIIFDLRTGKQIGQNEISLSVKDEAIVLAAFKNAIEQFNLSTKK